MKLDKKDCQLLDLLQTAFPITAKPFHELGKLLNLPANEVKARIKKLMAKGIIKYIGASFDSTRLGYVSTVVAAKVPAKKINKVAELVNNYKEVTHNYQRAGSSYNLWFTVIAESSQRLQEILKEISELADIKLYSLPAIHKFKLSVNFKG